MLPYNNAALKKLSGQTTKRIRRSLHHPSSTQWYKPSIQTRSSAIMPTCFICWRVVLNIAVLLQEKLSYFCGSKQMMLTFFSTISRNQKRKCKPEMVLISNIRQRQSVSCLTPAWWLFNPSDGMSSGDTGQRRKFRLDQKIGRKSYMIFHSLKKN